MRVEGSGFRVQGSGFRVQGLGCTEVLIGFRRYRVVLGFRFQGAKKGRKSLGHGFGMGLGFRVYCLMQGLGFVGFTGFMGLHSMLFLRLLSSFKADENRDPKTRSPELPKLPKPPNSLNPKPYIPQTRLNAYRSQAVVSAEGGNRRAPIGRILSGRMPVNSSWIFKAGQGLRFWFRV